MKKSKKGGITAKGKAFKGTMGKKMPSKSGAKKSSMKKYNAVRKAVFGLGTHK